MITSETRAPSAGVIDKACRLGYFVYFGNRQGIAGAATHFQDVPAEKGSVWISVLPDYVWRQVKASDVVISELSKSQGEVYGWMGS